MYNQQLIELINTSIKNIVESISRSSFSPYTNLVLKGKGKVVPRL
jgi:hypothetical protein